MSHSNDFDELARRKLDELRFPVDEAHWKDAQRAIHGGRKRRRAWIFGGSALLLILMALLWWPVPQDTPLAEVPEAPAPAPRDNTSTEGTHFTTDPAAQTAEARTDANAATSNAEGAHATETSVSVVGHTSTTERPIAPSTEHRSVAHAREPRHIEVPEHHMAMQPEVDLTVGLHQRTDTDLRSNEPVRTLSPTSEESLPTADAPTGNDQDAPTAVADNERPATVSDAMGESTLAEPDDAKTRPATQEGKEEEPSLAADAPNDPSSEVANDVTHTESTTATENPAQPSAVPDAGTQGTAGTVPATAASNNASTTTPATVANTTTPADSLPTTQAPKDSTQAVPTMIALPVPVTYSPWEVTALGGAISSTSMYTGPQSEEWNAASSSAVSSAFGVELMHMGGHFGIGTGVHYSTYAEQFNADAAYLISESWRRVYTLDPVDTALFFITDTIDIGGQPHYIGGSIDTTVYVLGSHFVQDIARTRTREARYQVNRVSYVEVPLLLDAHTVSGRWSFGIIGGPTVGLLSGRRGALPTRTSDGYIDLGDEAFRSLMFGYTARVYARFRIRDRWSLGVEPSVRGQLLSAFDGGDLTRRSQALGAQVSFTYRLP